FDGEDTGYLMSRTAGDVPQVESLFSMQIIAILVDIAKFVGGVVILLWLHWKLALLSAVVLPFFIGTIWLFRKRVRITSNELMETMGAFFTDLQQVFAGIVLLKALGRGKEEGDRVMKGLSRVFSAERRTTMLGAASAALMGLVTALGMAVVLGFGALEIMKGTMSVWGLMSFLGYLGFLYGPSRSLASFPIQIQPALVALRRVTALLELPPEPEGGIRPEKINGDIRFEDVTFGYNASHPVLEALSVSVRAGERLGIAGKTGTGKSTLLKLLLGFYHPQSGRITVDGIPVSDLDPAAFRMRVGYLPQNTFFFNETVEENLLWAAPAAKEEEVTQALRSAEALAFVSHLPDEKKTRIGEDGKKLSGGEKQRLAVARTLLIRPQLLVMDEGTSYLDGETEAQLLKNLLDRFQGQTVVVVSHRHSALRLMDRLVVMEGGRIVAQGPPEEVLREAPPAG
ncbi:MAG: ABC transporter ATP-binding protein, partial [Planctomycetota bacterium]